MSTHGGQHAFGHAGRRVPVRTQAVQQMRGTAGARQIAKPRWQLIHHVYDDRHDHRPRRNPMEGRPWITAALKFAIPHLLRGAERGRLEARRCHKCGKITFRPPTCCEHCGSFDVEWTTLSGKGTLLATHNITPACHPRFESIAP